MHSVRWWSNFFCMCVLSCPSIVMAFLRYKRHQIVEDSLKEWGIMLQDAPKFMTIIYGDVSLIGRIHMFRSTSGFTYDPIASHRKPFFFLFAETQNLRIFVSKEERFLPDTVRVPLSFKVFIFPLQIPHARRSTKKEEKHLPKRI